METSHKNSTTQTIVIIVLVLVVGWLLARFVFFKDQADQFGTDLKKLDQREQQYKADNPWATDEQVDSAFDEGMEGMKQRKATYMANNPWATEEQADAAMDAAFKSMEQ